MAFERKQYEAKYASFDQQIVSHQLDFLQVLLDDALEQPSAMVGNLLLSALLRAIQSGYPQNFDYHTSS